MQIGRTACADLRRKVDWQRADNGITALHLGWIEVGHVAIEGGAVLLHPLQCARVAADEKGSHGRACRRVAHEGGAAQSNKLAMNPTIPATTAPVLAVPNAAPAPVATAERAGLTSDVPVMARESFSPARPKETASFKRMVRSLQKLL